MVVVNENHRKGRAMLKGTHEMETTLDHAVNTLLTNAVAYVSQMNTLYPDNGSDESNQWYNVDRHAYFHLVGMLNTFNSRS